MVIFMKDALARRHDEKGFSLIELIVVVAILGILVAIAIPVYGKIQQTARQNATETQAANAVTSVSAAIAQDPTGALVVGNYSNSDYTISWGNKAAGGSLQAAPTSTDDICLTATSTHYKNDAGTGFLAAADGTASGCKMHQW